MASSVKNEIKYYLDQITKIPKFIINPAITAISVLLCKSLISDISQQQHFLPAIYFLNKKLLYSFTNNYNENIAVYESVAIEITYGFANSLGHGSLITTTVGAASGSLLGAVIGHSVCDNNSNVNLTVGGLQGFILGYDNHELENGAIGLIVGSLSYGVARKLQIENYFLTGTIFGNLFGGLSGAMIGGVGTSIAGYVINNILEDEVELMTTDFGMLVSDSIYG